MSNSNKKMDSKSQVTITLETNLEPAATGENLANTSETSSSASATTSAEANKTNKTQIQEKHLAKMEALLRHSAMGVHIIFENKDLASILAKSCDDKDFFDFQKMKQVQDTMTELVSKESYFDKMSYLQDLSPDAYELLVRTYFHIVENTVRANHEYKH